MSKNNYTKVHSVKDILDKMGFNKNSSLNTQKAFLQNIINSYNKNLKELKNTKKISKEENFQQLDLFKKVA